MPTTFADTDEELPFVPPPTFVDTSGELPSTPPQPTLPDNSEELPSTPPPTTSTDTNEELLFMPAPPAFADTSEDLPFSLPSDEVPVEPVSPVRSPPYPRPRQSPGSPSDVPSGSRQRQTDRSPTDAIAEGWRRATGRVTPSHEDIMLHKGPMDDTEDVEELDDDGDDSAPPPIIIVGSPSPPSSLSEAGEESSDPDLLSRPLLPCTRFDDIHDQVHTLFDLVWAALPRCPSIYELGQLEGTKAPTSTEYNIPQSHQLKNIVFCRDLLGSVETEVAALLHAIPFDRTNQAHMLFATRVFPWFTSRGSPKRIYSEVDTEDWIRDTLIGPAHAVIHAIMLGHIPDDDSPEYPFHSSAHCRFANRPDHMTVLDGEYPDEIISHLGEWKTTGVISIANNPLGGVQKPIENTTRLGAAYKFNWPAPSATIMRRDKILCQIWSQLWEWDVCYGTLSSMELTTFYMRKRLRRNTLYISRPYRTDDPTLFRMVCWLLLATGSNDLSLDVPLAFTRWWTPAMKKATSNGLVEIQ